MGVVIDGGRRTKKRSQAGSGISGFTDADHIISLTNLILNYAKIIIIIIIISWIKIYGLIYIIIIMSN